MHADDLQGRLQLTDQTHVTGVGTCMAVLNIHAGRMARCWLTGLTANPSLVPSLEPLEADSLSVMHLLLAEVVYHRRRLKMQ